MRAGRASVCELRRVTTSDWSNTSPCNWGGDCLGKINSYDILVNKLNGITPKSARRGDVCLETTFKCAAVKYVLGGVLRLVCVRWKGSEFHHDKFTAITPSHGCRAHILAEWAQHAPHYPRVPWLIVSTVIGETESERVRVRVGAKNSHMVNHRQNNIKINPFANSCGRIVFWGDPKQERRVLLRCNLGEPHTKTVWDARHIP